MKDVFSSKSPIDPMGQFNMLVNRIGISTRGECVYKIESLVLEFSKSRRRTSPSPITDSPYPNTNFRGKSAIF